MWRLVKQLFKEFWLPLLIGVAWTSFVVGMHGKISSYISNFAPSFFLASWLTGQVNRVRRDHKTTDSFSSLESQLAALGISIDTLLQWARSQHEADKPRNSPGAVVAPARKNDLKVVADRGSNTSKPRDEDQRLDTQIKVLALARYRAKHSSRFADEFTLRFAA